MPGLLARQLPGWRREAERLPGEIDELISGGKPSMRGEVPAKLWRLHCLTQLIEIAEAEED